MKNEPIILDSSDEAAKIATVTGWVSRLGRFWGDDERMARYDGCTHRGCDDCGKPVPKCGFTVCDGCRKKRSDARFAAFEIVEWDGETPLNLYDTDRYFFDADEVRDFIEERGIVPEELRLVLCEPEYLRQLDADIWEDNLPDDGELPDEVQEALDALNKVIAAQGPSCWRPTDKRVIWSTAETVSGEQK